MDFILTGLVKCRKQSRETRENSNWLLSVPQEWSHIQRYCELLF